MMILRSTPPSPFGRKVKLAASVLGLLGEIKVEPADTNDDNDSLRRQNPLGKIPVLVLEDGSTLYDSRVILEYLDHRAGGGKIMPSLDALEAEPPSLDAIPNVGQIAVACFLGHRDLRYAGDWRASRPKLVAWLDRFAAQVPTFAATKVTP